MVAAAGVVKPDRSADVRAGSGVESRLRRRHALPTHQDWQVVPEQDAQHYQLPCQDGNTLSMMTADSSLQSTGPIYKISYHYLTIMPKLQTTYGISLIYKTSYKGRNTFLGSIHLQNRKIVWDSVRKFAYNIPKRNLSMLYVTIVSRSYHKLRIILW